MKYNFILFYFFFFNLLCNKGVANNFKSNLIIIAEQSHALGMADNSDFPIGNLKI